MQFKHYELTGAVVAVSLCNIREPSASAYETALFQHIVQEPRVASSDVGAIAEWCQRLRPIFDAGDPLVRMELVNVIMDEAGCRPRLATHDGLPAHLHFHADGAALTERIRTMTAGGLAVVVATIGAERLGRCARAGCPEVFLDVSRSARRSYCSVRCASNVRVARHRAARARSA